MKDFHDFSRLIMIIFSIPLSLEINSTRGINMRLNVTGRPTVSGPDSFMSLQTRQKEINKEGRRGEKRGGGGGNTVGIGSTTLLPSFSRHKPRNYVMCIKQGRLNRVDRSSILRTIGTERERGECGAAAWNAAGMK